MNKSVWFGIGAYIAWGMLPVYWKLLSDVPVLQLLGHRFFWSFLFLLSWNLATRQWKFFKSITLTWRVLGIYSLAAILIAGAGLLFVWAIGAGYIVEISLGYFITPLVSVFLGVVITREHLRPLQWVPIGLAAFGLLYLTVEYGSFPWIALTLATTFGLYGLVKKIAPFGSMTGLTIETGILFLPALGFLIYSGWGGQGAFIAMDGSIKLLLIGAGIVTIIPLLMFSSAVQSVPLSLIGVLQYIEPTFQFILGALVYREPFSFTRLVGFVIIWVAAILFTSERLYVRKRQRHSV